MEAKQSPRPRAESMECSLGRRPFRDSRRSEHRANWRGSNEETLGPELYRSSRKKEHRHIHLHSEDNEQDKFTFQ